MHMHNPPHPGSVLREYLGNMPVSAAAEHLRTTRVTLSRVLNGKAGISANMALRLAAVDIVRMSDGGLTVLDVALAAAIDRLRPLR